MALRAGASTDAIIHDAVHDSGEKLDEGAAPPRTVVGAQRRFGVLFGLTYGCSPGSYAGNVAAEALFGRPELEQDPTSEQRPCAARPLRYVENGSIGQASWKRRGQAQRPKRRRGFWS